MGRAGRLQDCEVGKGGDLAGLHVWVNYGAKDDIGGRSHQVVDLLSRIIHLRPEGIISDCA